jgi:hypothetical protein
MSRKSAYALKARDSAFAAAWRAAATARAGLRADGDKVEEVQGPPISPRQGNSMDSELAFVGLLARLRDAPPLAA